MTGMRVSLVALPWSERERPSSALGALAAYIRRERPDDEVSVHYEYLHVAELIGLDIYDVLSKTSRFDSCEAMYASIFYPDRLEPVVQHAIKQRTFASVGLDGSDEEKARRVFAKSIPVLRDHLEALASQLASSADVVGMTTSFGQLFANLTLARSIKQLAPNVKIILGGSTLSDRVGVSVINEYDFIDYVVQGEGEVPLVALLDTIRGNNAAAPDLAGIVSRHSKVVTPSGAPLSELSNLDDLPIPSFDEYAALADQYSIPWLLPIEASRGCWWDRTKRTGNTKSTCYFCNLNIQWKGYREKSVERVANELEELVQRYRRLSVYFVDNIIRAKGAAELARAVKGKNLDVGFFYELRANLSSLDMLELVEAGLGYAQFGIEALSTSYLRRIGKGTTTIENLRAMRLCTELGVHHGGNLILSFPGSTSTEVAETVDVIRRFAYVYEPLETTRFALGVGNSVEVLSDEFGVFNIRNSDALRPAIPPDVFERMNFFDLDFDHDAMADWTPVLDAAAWWNSVYKSSPDSTDVHYRPILTYRDAGNFLVLDETGPCPRTLMLEGVQREVYLYCMEIRSIEVLERKFCNARISPQLLLEILAAFVEDRLMFTERHKYLSLAVAASLQVAARRIRAAQLDDVNLSQKNGPIRSRHLPLIKSSV
jgi:ribosomal peptide maturation radical SAM protein 1